MQSIKMSRISEITESLHALPCLSGLAGEELAVIGQMSSLLKVARNETLFEETDRVRFFFIMKNGSVKLYKTSQEGKELIVKIMAPGDYLCCAPLFAGGKYFMSAVALEDSTLVAIPADAFKGMLSDSLGDMGLKIIAGLCGRIRYLSNLVEDLTFKDVEQRVISALIRLADEKSPLDKTVTLTMTHQDIASLTGTVREVVSRTMSRLKKEGVIIDSSVRGFTVDKEKLVDLLNRKNPLLPV